MDDKKYYSVNKVSLFIHRNGYIKFPMQFALSPSGESKSISLSILANQPAESKQHNFLRIKCILYHIS